jgi:hypothetical protein
MTNCWLYMHGEYTRGEMPSCDGSLIRAHLIPRQDIKRALRGALPGVSREEERRWCDDTRCWVLACGGCTGLGGHHGMFDSFLLRVARSELPEGIEDFAGALDLTWLLDRKYGNG